MKQRKKLKDGGDDVDETIFDLFRSLSRVRKARARVMHFSLVQHMHTTTVMCPSAGLLHDFSEYTWGVTCDHMHAISMVHKALVLLPQSLVFGAPNLGSWLVHVMRGCDSPEPGAKRANIRCHYFREQLRGSRKPAATRAIATCTAQSPRAPRALGKAWRPPAGTASVHALRAAASAHAAALLKLALRRYAREPLPHAVHQGQQGER